MNNILNNIKKVMLVFLLCFIGLISYMTYFEMLVGPNIVNSSYNRRMWIKRNEVLRGTIYDRNGNPLTKSEPINSETQKREYTGGEVFSHALGYVDEKYGITGLERKYDDELMSTDVKDNLKSLIENKGKSIKKVGNGVKTTLDTATQKKAYDLLGENRGAVVALNPKTGEVIAMVSKPSFDPNNLKDSWADINKNSSRPLLNRATAGLYPPGSTFKTVTAISALENISGVRSKTINDTGSVQIGSDYVLHNYNGEVLGSINFEEAYAHSSNVYFGTLGLELGNDKLKETAEEFYFNKSIPTDGIPVEPSHFPALKSYERGSIAQSAIGQSSDLASPLQMAVLVSTIANGGVMMKPHLVTSVVTSKGELVKTISPESIGQIISPDIANTMKNMMKSVVDYGTGTGASISGIEVSGKTGTADNQVMGQNSPPHSWFIGFAPYEDPQVAIAVIVENGGQGGLIAASIASQVIAASLGK
ncbi:MAG: penicillin-binding protein 2 [Clostridium sp.]|jgi:peptidoglycan glycosyltransferase|uniref:peptidoglycan D,D-transpeptidase FtsI family protein n=1 Tax=Clostridium sp. TaxID=1506 RepID=UPI0025C63E79|nr:penicillin-binding transpeptidase domain-containing protein [Clostridium sp.]MCH3965881.1 penicillin-binding protein 2 [Clostridium sp.]MCI1716030.1 penicillin-binding protein 2 [Clostridium sp.]MCI1800298.1 penicillin-binding protein 2 [Clostridium sp.]MCI1814207.1 penicillin-binding protein 2 [Clostridium sp.]MCI1871106.1 penicillin-binding protein 2 [Clostridium sp.]